jgi:hypothetical protein
MAAMSSSSELLSLRALMLANSRTSCTQPGRTALSSRPMVVVNGGPAAT